MKLVRLIVIIGLLMLTVVVSAQDATPETTAETTPEATSENTTTSDTTLSYGVPVAGAISGSSVSQTWTLQTASADRITIVVERTDGNLIPDVNILDSNSQPIAQSYGPDRSQAIARIDDVRLPAASTYQVQVTRQGGETGLTEGAYTLTIIPLGTAEDNPNNIVPLGEVMYDSPIQGEITATQWVNRYTLNALGADVIRVTAERVSGTLFPEVEVLDVNGASIRIGYTDNEGDAATVDAPLPNAGQYTVIVRRSQGFTGDTAGVYQLTVELLGAGEGSSVLQAPIETIAYDTPLEGQLVDGRWYQDWQLVTQAGDTITITVERGEGNLQPEVAFLGGSGQELRRGYADGTYATATIDRYRLDVPGTYTIRVLRSRDINGTTEGTYTLTVTLDGSGEGSPVLSTSSGTLAMGTPGEGEITNINWLNAWAYTAQDGERVDIVVNRSGGTLIPRVAIQDANGQTLREAYPEETGDVAIIRDFAIPAAGEYRVVVYRLDDQDGLTSGTYKLTVRPTEQ
jgi:hypothetical protein